jgi:5-methylcytosine-specific restriction endonuclease McrA
MSKIFRVCPICETQFERQGTSRALRCSPECRRKWKIIKAGEWAKANRERQNATFRKYYHSHKTEHLMRTKIRTMRIKGIGGKVSKQEWDEIKAKYQFKCLRCGKKKKLTMDHIIPISSGGSHTVGNIQPLCGPCNSIKATNTIDYRT